MLGALAKRYTTAIRRLHHLYSADVSVAASYHYGSLRTLEVSAMIAGIDISHYNGQVDCNYLPTAGIHFAYIKATEGRFTKDHCYAANYAGLKSNAIPRGAYHFFYPQVDPDAQADNFLSVVTQINAGDLPPVVDIEISGELAPTAIAMSLQQWLDRVEETLGRRPIIYTGPAFWNTAMAGTTAFSEYPLWVAHYTSNGTPRIPRGFSDFVFWQYSESGSLAGMNGAVDMDWFNGSPSDLVQLTGIENSDRAGDSLA
jgi:lysozyme